jgi:signal transduction histidine kinase
MSKLQVAKAIQKTFTIAGTVFKWIGIAILTVGLCTGLWAWSQAHFLSFAIIIGIVVAFFTMGGVMEAWDWSQKTIEKARQEELEEQERERTEKRRQELKEQAPRISRTVPRFDDYHDHTDPYAVYR